MSAFVRDSREKVFEERDAAHFDLVGSVAAKEQKVNAVLDLFFVDCSEVLYQSTF